ncbi:Putative ribonuclease H protein At1g65750 [Linum grandiflorum]
MERGSEWRLNCSWNSSGWSVWFWIWKVSHEFWGLAFVDPDGGEWVRFWHDVWIPGKHLARVFPRIASPDAFIFDLYSLSDRLLWDVHLTTTLRGGALQELHQFLELLSNLPEDAISSGPPRLSWQPDLRRGFSVKSFVSSLLLDRFPGNALFSMTAVWISTVPTKVCCFSWMACMNSIATIDNLKRRGFIVPNRCTLCYHAEESASHLLVHCAFADAVWVRFSQTVGGFGPRPRDIMPVFQEWNEGQGFSIFDNFRRVLHHAIIWFLWMERNNRIFRDESSSTTQLVWKIALNTARWLVAHRKVSSSEVSLWLNAIFHPP